MLNSLVVSGSPSLGPVGSPANRIKMKMQDTSKDKFRNSRDDTNALDISRHPRTRWQKLIKSGFKVGKSFRNRLSRHHVGACSAGQIQFLNWIVYTNELSMIWLQSRHADQSDTRLTPHRLTPTRLTLTRLTLTRLTASEVLYFILWRRVDAQQTDLSPAGLDPARLVYKRVHHQHLASAYQDGFVTAISKLYQSLASAGVMGQQHVDPC